jgi:NAD(P)H-dependent flavin oxidoreductase YrpB (nitropropane dioxygenase family)
VPVLLAPFGPWDQTRLAAEVSRAGALASLGTATRTATDLTASWEWLRKETGGPVVINHTGRPLDREAFEATLRLQPAAVSFHMGCPPT